MKKVRISTNIRSRLVKCGSSKVKPHTVASRVMIRTIYPAFTVHWSIRVRVGRERHTTEHSFNAIMGSIVDANV